MKLSHTALVALPILLFGCAAAGEKSAPQARGTPAAVTYAGELPCADCPGQRITLTLLPDFTFRLRRTYIGVDDGKDRDVYDLGRWARTQDDGKRLRLGRGSEAMREFVFVRPDTLRALDREGKEIRSELNYDLVRQASVDRLEGPLRIRGMYAYMADAAVLNECVTGKRYPVLLEAEHRTLEKAYLAERRAPGEFIAVILTARFVERAPEPGAAAREHVVVEKFERILPGETCAPQAAASAELLETSWRPVEIDGHAVSIPAGTREPHIILRREAGRVTGFTGCNTLGGSFKQNAGDLAFSGLLTTRKACLSQVANALESVFVRTLETTASYRIMGESLELRDAAGQTRMRLEARYLR